MPWLCHYNDIEQAVKMNILFKRALSMLSRSMFLSPEKADDQRD